MILSFHPIYEGNKNIICAGRKPDASDLKEIRKAKAVILPQGCSEELYRMAVEHCPHVFPNYHTRFLYPGKLNQASLFSFHKVLFPGTRTFSHLESFLKDNGESPGKLFDFPFVFKFDWGGEGDFVFLVRSQTDFAGVLHRAEKYEKTGQKGFLLQKFIPCGGRSLRVVVIHDQLISYWRTNQGNAFYGNLKNGGVIDFDSDPDLQEAGKEAVKSFCAQTNINLAGLDLIFSQEEKDPTPFFIEINYFFGRRGLGGSESYYSLLIRGIESWIKTRGLNL
ncbi:MAG: glutathione synthase [Desulfobacteraceae bacterium]|nr:glutathione synthase [Desulfobacteraceae bacterium]MBU4055582.1 glutathione synthase [Pseudomonadota bacterium]